MIYLYQQNILHTNQNKKIESNKKCCLKKRHQIAVLRSTQIKCIYLAKSSLHKCLSNILNKPRMSNSYGWLL